MEAIASHAFARTGSSGERAPISRALAVEAPVAIEVNGIAYAVLMATPADLADLAYGFLLTERLIERASDILGVDEFENEAGIVLRVAVREAAAERLVQRVRHRTADASCGLCGIETLEQAMRPLPTVLPTWAGNDAAIFAALAALDAEQVLNHATRAVHAAARCSAEGAIVAVREDVGRHNAFDKLIGAMLRGGAGWRGGFALLTARCSYELVEKAALAGCPLLATISAPTDLAVRRAAEAHLPLRVLARPDALLAT